MNDQSRMSGLGTWPDTNSATSSLASASGAPPSAPQASPTTSPCGPAPAPASLSARQAKEMGLLTSGTYGPLGSISLASENLQSYLANKLRARVDTNGSTLFKLTWKRWATPAGRSFSLLRASGRRCSATELTGWPTPEAGNFGGDKNIENVFARRQKYAEKYGNNGFGLTTAMAAQLASWPSPTVGNAEGSQKPKDASPTGRRPDGSKATVALPMIAALSGPARLTASGEMLTGSDAAMENSGQLNPAHSRWLMGLQSVWDDCAVTATQSVARKRRHSSKL